MEYSNLFVCLMGICTVFIGLICIIILVSVMSGIVRKTEKSASSKASDRESTGTAQAVIPGASGARLSADPGKITPEMVAAISAAIAQELGTGVDAIRILSIKKA